MNDASAGIRELRKPGTFLGKALEFREAVNKQEPDPTTRLRIVRPRAWAKKLLALDRR